MHVVLYCFLAWGFILPSTLSLVPWTPSNVTKRNPLVSYEFTGGDDEGWVTTTYGDGVLGPSYARATPAGTLMILPGPLLPGVPTYLDGPSCFIPYSDSTAVVVRMRQSGGGGVAALSWRDAVADSSLPPPTPDLGATNQSWGQQLNHRSQFSVHSDGEWHTYSIPIHPSGRRYPRPTLGGAFLQMRLEPQVHPTDLNPILPPSSNSNPIGLGQGGVEVDFIRVVAQPTILKVEGCSNMWGGVAAAAAAAAAAGGGANTSIPPPPFVPRYTPQQRQGSLNKYFLSFGDAVSSRAGAAWAQSNSGLEWGTTYNCAPMGGDRVMITGEALGSPTTPPLVWVDGQPCKDVGILTPETVVVCTLPPARHGRVGTGAVEVTVSNGDMPVLYDSKPFVEYATPPPPPPTPPLVTNVASRSLSLSWASPTSPWTAPTVSGYLVSWRGAVLDDASEGASGVGVGGEEGRVSGYTGSGWEVDSASDSPLRPSSGFGAGGRVGKVSVGAGWDEVGGSSSAASVNPSVQLVGNVAWGPWGSPPFGGEVVVDNRTSVTIRGLIPGVRYQFRVATLCETAISTTITTTTTTIATGSSYNLSVGDLYGVRPGLLPGALMGEWSPPSVDARTLLYDAFFSHFDANTTLDWGPVFLPSSVNALGWSGGEGHYGLSLVGWAGLGGGNSTHVCCDGYGGVGFLDALRGAIPGGVEDRGLSSGTPGVGEGVYDSVTPRAAPLPSLYHWNEGEGSGVAGTWSPLLPNASWLESRWHSDNLNTGTLPGYYRPSCPQCEASGAASFARAAAAAGGGVWGGDRSVSPGAPIFRAGRLSSSDALLGRALGSSLGRWASPAKYGESGGGKWEGCGVWDEYEDGGTIRLVPQSILWDLGNETRAGSATVDALLSSFERARKGGYAVGVGVAWAGRWVPGGQGEPIVDPMEFTRGPLDPTSGTQGPAPEYPWTPGREGSYTPASSPGGRRGLAGSWINPEAPGMPRTIPVVAPTPPLSLQQRWTDSSGKLLFPWPFDPTLTCTLVATGSAAPGDGGGGGGGGGYGLGANTGDFNGADPFGWQGILGAVGDSSGGGVPPTTESVTGRYATFLSGGDAAGGVGGVGSRLPRPSASTPSSTTVTTPTESPSLTHNATAPCGPALRLTPSHGFASGAAWYARPQDVREGFDTTFVFRVANPSRHCGSHTDVDTRCVSRGGGGFAFVVQTAGPGALGNGSAGGLGYEGITPSLAVEFDTWEDGGLGDPGNNHVSVHSRGVFAPNSPHHNFSLGAAYPGRDLGEGIHSARVVYHPLGLSHSPTLPHSPHWRVTPFARALSTDLSGGGGGWGGYLSVWVDGDLGGGGDEPILTIPLDLNQVLGLGRTQGRAWCGFTAATGVEVWQQHDILGWHFTSLREDFV